MAEIKVTKDFEGLYKQAVQYHNSFMQYIDDRRIRGKVPIENRMTVADDFAEKMGLVYYKGVFVEPAKIVPPDIQEAIDKHLDLKDLK